MQFTIFWTLSFELGVNVDGQATQCMWYQQFATVIAAISFFTLFREACFMHVRIIKGCVCVCVWGGGGGALGVCKGFINTLTDNYVEDPNE